MRLKYLSFLLLLLTACASLTAQFPRFKALAFYSEQVEPAHVEFAHDAIRFFEDLSSGDGFVFDKTTNMDNLTSEKLKDYSVIIMLNDLPSTEEQRKAFQEYMENGGGWFGFHFAAYNDPTTNWPWFLEFLGGGVFWRNNWPPMPAKLIVNNALHEVTWALPQTFMAPTNEWYQWNPSPRLNPDIEVLVSLSEDNYPFGLKDIIPDGDCPVVWTNKNYRMIYMNMGHGNRIFTDPTQNQLIISGFRWVVASDEKGNVFE
jgi:type 1 glutamine amidotransferase